MFSFRFLNPRLLDEHPRHMNDACYRAMGDKPEVLCSEIPPNQWRFLGWWYITPERHFWEWLGFSTLGILLVTLLGPKLSPKEVSSSSYTRRKDTAGLVPRRWMKVSTLIFYPLVILTKMSWPDSNYPGRWLLFVGMPVGTLWIISVFFCGSSIVVWFKPGQRRRNDLQLYKIRFWLLETWLSFLPLIVNLLPALFQAMVFSLRKYANGQIHSGTDGDNATIAYFCHAMYLAMTPMYYVCMNELSSHSTMSSRKVTLSVFWKLLVDCALKQSVGTSICVVYYMGILTPASILGGVNVNFLLWGGGGPNFRLWYVVKWFCYGSAIRTILGITKLAVMRGILRRSAGANANAIDSDHALLLYHNLND